jgi:hypothetical protein
VATKTRIDRLSAAELAEIAGEHEGDRPFYVPGRAYQWILSHGWVRVGYYVRHVDPLTVRVAHCSYYRSAGGQTHAALSAAGGNAQTAWEYQGDHLIGLPHVLGVSVYHGEVHRGRVAHR